MNDPRLNSVHLPSGRREEFRNARESLFKSEGLETLVASDRAEAQSSQSVPTDYTAIVRTDAESDIPAKFVLTDSSYSYPLKVGINTVGRMPNNDVVVPDPYVSRRHIAILVHTNNQGCELHDIASKNGTFVNDKPVQGPIRLQTGDKITLSEYVLFFRANGDSGIRADKNEPTQID